MESSAIRILKERMLSRKTDLIRAFQLQDRSKSGNKIMLCLPFLNIPAYIKISFYLFFFAPLRFHFSIFTNKER